MIKRYLFLRCFASYILLFLFETFALSNSSPITLRLSVWEGPPGITAIQKTLDDFEKIHPNIKVKLETPGYRYFSNKLLIQYAANVAPDVVAISTIFSQRFASKGVLLPLDPFIKSTSKLNLNDYYSESLDSLRYNGNLYFLPRDVSPVALLYYNKRLFKEAGIPYPDGNWTWDYKIRPELKEKDFLWVLQKLTKFNERQKPIQWGLCSYTPMYISDNFALETGARFINDPINPKKVELDDPKIIKAYQFTADLASKMHFLPTNTEVKSVFQKTTRDLWLTQKVAMYLSGTWDIPRCRAFLVPGSKHFFDWDITLFPAYKDGTRKYLCASTGYSILSTTKYQQESWALVRWLSGAPGMKHLMESGLAHPAIKKFALSEPWIPGPKTPIEQQYPRNRIIIDKAIKYGWYEPKSEFWPQVKDLLEDRMPSLWNGFLSAEKILKEVNRIAQGHLDRVLEKNQRPKFNWVIAVALSFGAATLLAIWIYWPERIIKYSKSQRLESKAAYLFLSPWLFGAIIFILGPMIFSLVISTTDWNIIEPARWLGAQNYIEAFTIDSRFWMSIKVTFVYTLIAVPLGVSFSLLLALLLNLKIKGMAIFRSIFYLPSLASIVVTCYIWRKIFQTEGGLLNTIIYGQDGQGNFLGLANLLSQYSKHGEMIDWVGNESTALVSIIIMSLWGAGTSMIVLLAGLQNIPSIYQEAALIDGANLWQRFLKITFPLLSPSIWFCIVTGVIGSFQVFTKAFVLTHGGPGDTTRFMVLYLYNQAFDFLRMGYASALAWVLFIIILAFTMLQFKMSKWVYYEVDRGENHL